MAPKEERKAVRVLWIRVAKAARMPVSDLHQPIARAAAKPFLLEFSLRPALTAGNYYLICVS